MNFKHSPFIQFKSHIIFTLLIIFCSGISHALEIGDEGPGGGIIFFIDDDEVHGLEAAPKDLAASQWCPSFGIIGNLSDDVGAGISNTVSIIANCSGESFAAKLADNYISQSGDDDWYLPSKKELDLMFINLAKNGIGDFSKNTYWSSSESGICCSWHQIFANGYQSREDKDEIFSVRPIRNF